jgi:hypothetical protein
MEPVVNRRLFELVDLDSALPAGGAAVVHGLTAEGRYVLSGVEEPTTTTDSARPWRPDALCHGLPRGSPGHRTPFQREKRSAHRERRPWEGCIDESSSPPIVLAVPPWMRRDWRSAMSWAKLERLSLAVSVVFAFASAVIGFRWVASPFLKGYAAAAGGFFLLSRWAGAHRPP